MSEEIKQLIDYLQEFVNDDRKQITKYGVEISQDSTKLLLNYIEQLQQENKHLKEKLDIADANYDIIYDYFSKVNEILGTELCEEVLSEILKLKSENEELKKQVEIKNSGFMASIEEVCDYAIVLIEFEKWLEENYCLYIPEIKQNSAIGKVYDKLQELKEGKK